MENEYAFEMAASNIRFSPGVTREVGMDLAELKAQRVMVVTDPNLAKLPPVATVLESLESERIQFELFDRVHVETTDISMREAISFAQQNQFDAFVAVGGGSAMDTAKAANLYSTYPADFLDYVNAPIGKGKPVPGALKPLYAVPTTAGTGSETTGVVIFDLLEMHAKTGIAHRYLKPTLGLIDPENTRLYGWRKADVLRVNLAGREPGGIIQLGDEYNSLIKEVKNKLEVLVDPRNGRKPIRKVWLRHEAYPMADQSTDCPDLVIEWGDYLYECDTTLENLLSMVAELLQLSVPWVSSGHGVSPLISRLLRLSS